MKKIGLLLPIYFAVAPLTVAQARDQFDPTMYTATTTTDEVTTTTTMRGRSIQSLASQAVGNTDRGYGEANAAMLITGAGVLATCNLTPPNPACPYWAGGLAASTAVRAFMALAGGTSKRTFDGVTTDDVPYNPANPGDKPKPNDEVVTKPGTDYTQDPVVKKTDKILNDLKKDGWKVDIATGSVTTPAGKKYTAAALNSAESMRADGLSNSDIKSLQSAISKIPKLPSLAGEKAKSSDSQDSMFGDESTGGGGAKSASTAGVKEGYNNYGSQLYAKTAGSIERDPAQIAGMSKDFNGSKIGVAADSLFDMIDRRYNYHQKAGSFLGGSPQIPATGGPAN